MMKEIASAASRPRNDGVLGSVPRNDGFSRGHVGAPRNDGVYEIS